MAKGKPMGLLASLMLRFSVKKPSFFFKTRFLFVLCTFF